MHVSKCAARGSLIIQDAKMTPSAHHRTTLSGYIFTTKACIDNQKNFVKQQYLLHNVISPQYGKLWPANSWDRFGSLGHSSKFQRLSRLGLVTAPTSLTGGQPNLARFLAVSWAGTPYIHFRGLLPLDGILPRAKFTLRPSVAFSYIGSVTAESAKRCGVVQGMELRNFRRGRHLYSAGRPSRWASARILVSKCFSRTVNTRMCKGLNSKRIVSQIERGTRDISSFNRAHGVGYIDRYSECWKDARTLAMCSLPACRPAAVLPAMSQRHLHLCLTHNDITIGTL